MQFVNVPNTNQQSIWPKTHLNLAGASNPHRLQSRWPWIRSRAHSSHSPVSAAQIHYKQPLARRDWAPRQLGDGSMVAAAAVQTGYAVSGDETWWKWPSRMRRTVSMVRGSIGRRRAAWHGGEMRRRGRRVTARGETSAWVEFAPRVRVREKERPKWKK